MVKIGTVYASLKKAYAAFLYHYKTPKQLEQNIVWDKECDQIFSQIVEKMNRSAEKE